MYLDDRVPSDHHEPLQDIDCAFESRHALAVLSWVAQTDLGAACST